MEITMHIFKYFFVTINHDVMWIHNSNMTIATLKNITQNKVCLSVALKQIRIGKKLFISLEK